MTLDFGISAQADEVCELPQARLRYRVLTGPDDRSFCERVSAALDDGYVLHGAPALTFDGSKVVVAQALVLADPAPPMVRPAPGG